MSVNENIEVRVRGTVQGVGFRPTVWRLAHDNDLVGEVHNDTDGVLIRLSGEKTKLSNFLTDLTEQAPPLSKIDSVDVHPISAKWSYDAFSISHSDNNSGLTEVTADAATCPECLKEIFNPDERRYQYPFTNCTHCGPRLTIVQGIPYDRVQTTMSNFPMCSQCQQEYKNPADRRFHAQPIACHKCGPRVYVEAPNHRDFEPPVNHDNSKRCDDHKLSVDKLAQVQRCLEEGLIVAIRGIGGFHLSCDASNNDAVARLRERKHRYAKPFALMTHDTEIIAQYCHVSAVESQQLASPQAPIVLLNRQSSAQGEALSEHISPGTNLYGFMLPYTPLHWLVAKAFGKPLVMTSGNLSQQPQITDNDEAIEKLADIADVILYHDRDIANRIDDSVVRIMADKPRLLRRARGYAPRSIHLPKGFEDSPELLAYGAELKSTFCLLKQGSAIVSQHQGDLEDLMTYDDYEKNLDLYTRLFDHHPTVFVADKHPEYLSTKLANTDMAQKLNNDEPATLIQVQHHHAHIASCLAENQIPLDDDKVLGLAIDGLGFGEDGTIWGGEFLLADYSEAKRVARFKPIAMIGGAQAIRMPWRNTYAHILNTMTWDEYQANYAGTELAEFFTNQPLSIINRMIEEGVNVPLASSCGRLFDAVTAAVGICREQARFEGQGAIEFETLVDMTSSDIDQPYPFAIDDETTTAGEQILTINSAPMWHSLLQDLAQNVATTTIANRFHAGLINIITTLLVRLLDQHSLNRVALSGGCMQNKFLLEGITTGLQSRGIECLSHSQVPSNDGGISLGQAAIGAARILRKQS